MPFTQTETKLTAPSLDQDTIKTWKLTKAQVRAVDQIRRYIERRIEEHNEYAHRPWEFKTWEIIVSQLTYDGDTKFPAHLSVRATIGLTQDEGTMNALFSREHWQIFISKAGGLRARKEKGSGYRRGRAALIYSLGY